MAAQDIRTTISRIIGPGCLAGVTVGDWFSFLLDNGFSVSPSCLLRAAHLSLTAPITSVLGAVENGLFGKGIARQTISPPVFIIGSWRSGTTYLHNLMCCDDRFAYPNLFQTVYPHTFLVAESWYRPILETFSPKKRFMDNVRMGLAEPAEDELALGIMCGRSNMLAWVFPHRAAEYEKFLSFRKASPRDVSLWQQSLKNFVQKLAWKFQKPLILKSPNHTARIRLIRAVFPEARFLHIRRNPFEVYSSMCHMAAQVTPHWRLQIGHEDISDIVVRFYRELYDAYFEQVGEIPANRFFEVDYRDLVADPVGKLSAAYSALELPDFEYARPMVSKYLDSLGDYKTNRYQELPDDVQSRLRREWKQSFDSWGY